MQFKRQADFSLNADETKTKYLTVKGVSGSLDWDPKYSFDYSAAQAPHSTLHPSFPPFHYIRICFYHSKLSHSTTFLSFNSLTESLI